MHRLVVFQLDDRRYGLPLADVERVVRIAEITPLPKAPEIVLGVLNVQGRIVPVVNVRRRFRIPEREPELGDQLLVARTPSRPVALWVDRVAGVSEYGTAEAVSAEQIVPGLEYLAGIAKLTDGLVLIHDLGRFLSLEEASRLEQAMAHG
jgi:purine-binding chemotaxis protein CheW